MSESASWGSDYLARMLRELDLKYLAFNPGSSYRGLHDSLVDQLGGRDPDMVLCLHEEHAIAMAHGYAKVTGQPMGVALHANVGLMHATMAIYNAWCDRVPMVIIGATGPVDAAQRRPWIDWLHTSKDQAALVRPFIKWDDQPASLAAAAEAFARARTLCTVEPAGPVYICLDASLQEAPVDTPPALPSLGGYLSYQDPYPPPASVERIAKALAGARNPMLLMGRVTRSTADWEARVALAERFGARVVTDLRVGAAFPTTHPLHVSPAYRFMRPEIGALMRDADVILSLDWLDLGGTLAAAGVGESTAVFHVSLDHAIHNGWSADHQALPRATLHVASTVRHLVEALLAAGPTPARAPVAAQPAAPARKATSPGPITLQTLAHAVRRATQGHTVCFTRLPLGWPDDACDFQHPLDYLGNDGGAGIGSGPGMAVGTALALKNSDRLPVAVLGDGDFIMGSNAWWTAANMKLPMLVVVNNNKAYFNDVVHQEKVARQRGRPLENKWVGQRITDPDIDICAIARGQGASVLEPVTRGEQLDAALAEGMRRALAGELCVIDVQVDAGWAPGVQKALTA